MCAYRPTLNAHLIPTQMMDPTTTPSQNNFDPLEVTVIFDGNKSPFKDPPLKMTLRAQVARRQSHIGGGVFSALPLAPHPPVAPSYLNLQVQRMPPAAVAFGFHPGVTAYGWDSPRGLPTRRPPSLSRPEGGSSLRYCGSRKGCSLADPPQRAFVES